MKQRQPCIYADGLQNLAAYPLLDYVSSGGTWKMPSPIAMSGTRAEQSMRETEKLSERSVLKRELTALEGQRRVKSHVNTFDLTSGGMLPVMTDLPHGGTD